MVEIYTEILGFTAPSSLSAGATVNVRVQVKNASGVTGHAVCYIDGNPFDPSGFGYTVGSEPAYLGPGASAWVDVTLWAAMPAWNFVLTARNYELTSNISRTIALTAAMPAYFHEVIYSIGGLIPWGTLWSDATGPAPVDPPNYSSRPAKVGDRVYFIVGWFNAGDVPVIGHVDTEEITAPSGAIYNISAGTWQEDPVKPGAETHVSFSGLTLNEAGSWKLKVVLKTAGTTLDEMTTSFTVAAALPTSATVTVRGKCTGGYPIPSMLLETYDKGVKIKSKILSVVSIGTLYEDSVVVTGAGIHRAQGRMVLTNRLGSYEFLTPVKEFTLG